MKELRPQIYHTCFNKVIFEIIAINFLTHNILLIFHTETCHRSIKYMKRNFSSEFITGNEYLTDYIIFSTL